jgi:uncharacterized membrane protein YgaE (UPF0421/DUF939 family)
MNKENIIFTVQRIALEVLIVVEGVVWDMLETVRSRRAKLTHYMHKRHKEHIALANNTHMRNDVHEIIQKDY